MEAAERERGREREREHNGNIIKNGGVSNRKEKQKRQAKGPDKGHLCTFLVILFLTSTTVTGALAPGHRITSGKGAL